MRLFLALDLPVKVRRALADVQATLRKSCPGWRWVRPEGIHLTLRFLGEVAPEREAPLRDRWACVASRHPPVRFEVGGAGAFPLRGRPRVFWVGIREISGPVLPSLATELEQEAREAGFPAESRPFHPHLTLARALRGARAVRPPDESVGTLGVVESRELSLFQSRLGPGGARYTRLAAFPLAGGDGP